MFCRILLALVICLISGATVRAQDRPQPPLPNPFQGTPEEQAACRQDSVTLCRDAIPDSLRVLACLQQNRNRISKACRQVLESHGQ
jgi:hypothetical protein